MQNKPFQSLPALQWRIGAAEPAAIERAVPEETAIGLCYDSEPYAVLMATPADLEDLAVGFTLTERIADAADVEDVRASEHPHGVVVDVLLTSEGRRKAGRLRPRNLEGRSGCGLCGVQSLEDAIRPLAPLANGLEVRREAVQAALEALEAQTPLGRLTRATHAAGWADLSGQLKAVREDVGRHNALDKLIGAAARAGFDPAEAFIAVTSRCSYEMVEKTAIAGVGLLAAISAPTALAIAKARTANLTLIALARSDGHMVFTGAERVLDGVSTAPSAPSLAAIILTGGASRRMGVDKAAQMWGDRRAVDHVAALAQAVGAAPIITCGGGDFGLPSTSEPVPLSGPVAGVMAGLAQLKGSVERVLILAVDAPTIRASDLAPLLEAGGAGAAFAGFPLPMVVALTAIPAEARGDWPLRRLAECAGLARLSPDPDAAARIRGANTPEEQARLSLEAGLGPAPS